MLLSSETHLRPLPPLSPLRAFEATVRLGSMTRAAEELGRTHGAISRQVRSLEDALGVTLIDRDGARLAPTPAGAEFFAEVAAAFTVLEKAVARLPARRGTTLVRFACGSTTATRWLVPRLPRFYEDNPGISIQLAMGLQSIYDVGDFDVGTTWDRLNYDPVPGEHIVSLGDVAFAAVCRPDYPHEVDGRRLAIDTLLVSDTTMPWPSAYEQKAGVEIAAKRTMTFPHIHLCIEAALAGLGATLVETRLVGDELADGRLIAPLGTLDFEGGFLAVLNKARPPTAAVKRLIRWLQKEAAIPADPRRTPRDVAG